MSNVLIVEDEGIVAMELEMYIKGLGHEIVGICSFGEDAIEIANRRPLDIVIMDISLKGRINGIESARIIKQNNPMAEIIFLTAHFDDENIQKAAEINPISYLSKPFNRAELKAALSIAEHKKDEFMPEVDKPQELIKLSRDFFYYKTTGELFKLKELVILTNLEGKLLKLFINNLGLVVDIFTIESTIWSDEESNINRVRTLVKRLRDKLDNRFIKTVQSRGYILTPEV